MCETVEHVETLNVKFSSSTYNAFMTSSSDGISISQSDERIYFFFFIVSEAKVCLVIKAHLITCRDWIQNFFGIWKAKETSFSIIAIDGAGSGISLLYICDNSARISHDSSLFKVGA